MATAPAKTDTLTHCDATRKNAPTAELQAFMDVSASICIAAPLVTFDTGARNPYIGHARKVERLPTHLVRQVTNWPMFLRRGGMGLAKRSGIASGSGD